MSIYELHEFQPDRLLSGQIDPTRVIPTKYNMYVTASNGVTLINENVNITDLRSFISLYSTKISNTRFDQVIDSSFKEFPPFVNDTTIRDLQARIAELEASASVLLATDTANKNLIDTLNNQLTTVSQISLVSTQTNTSNNPISTIPSELKIGERLLSNLASQNKLQSPNGRYIFQLNFDGSLSLFENITDANEISTLNLVDSIASLTNGRTDPRQALRNIYPSLYYVAEIVPRTDTTAPFDSLFSVTAYADGKSINIPGSKIYSSTSVDSIESTVIRLLDNGRLILTVENEAEYKEQNPGLTTLSVIMSP
jgi:hypothetical protein